MPKTILIVDDDKEDQEIFESVIESLNQPINCVFASNAEDALNTIIINMQTKPDFIFLDLNLPFMNGFECLYAIKNQDELQHIPVIIYSTSSRESDIQKAKEMGASTFLTKPSNITQLKLMLQEVVH